jgi:hypothetical protein
MHAVLQRGHIIHGRYVLEEDVGTGAMAVVWRAEDRTFPGRKCAIKFLRDGLDRYAAARLNAEAATLAAIPRHSGIVQVFDRGVLPDGRPFYVMEWIAGDTLSKVLMKEGRLGVMNTIVLGLKLVDALRAAHQAGVIHRDIKPNNIMLTGLLSASGSSDGLHVHVLDFGCARSSYMPRTEGFLGTLHYASPEQTIGEDVGPETDIYSLGLVLFHCLAGELPYDGQRARQLAEMREEPLSLLTVMPSVRPRQLAALVDRVLRRDPSRRPTLFELSSTLGELVESLNLGIGRGHDVCSTVREVYVHELAAGGEHGRAGSPPLEAPPSSGRRTAGDACGPLVVPFGERRKSGRFDAPTPVDDGDSAMKLRPAAGPAVRANEARERRFVVPHEDIADEALVRWLAPYWASADRGHEPDAADLEEPVTERIPSRPDLEGLGDAPPRARRS